jgi:hypothetical protein
VVDRRAVAVQHGYLGRAADVGHTQVEVGREAAVQAQFLAAALQALGAAAVVQEAGVQRLLELEGQGWRHEDPGDVRLDPFDRVHRCLRLQRDAQVFDHARLLRQRQLGRKVGAGAVHGGVDPTVDPAAGLRKPGRNQLNGPALARLASTSASSTAWKSA